MGEGKTRYAQVGIGGRARMYYEALASDYADCCSLVGFCDISRTRMDYANRQIAEKFGAAPVPAYDYTDFERMIRETKPDIVIVTSIDRTHDDYIVRAMELGCDVVTEKPITTDQRKAQRIIDAQKAAGRSIRVAFNYRYVPHHTKMRELILQGVIGEIYSVHFEWLLNTVHGADYYRRWHRNKVNSGGLLVHKATHHFDLVHFWLGTEPETVFAFGDTNFYGRQNAERRGETRFYDRCHGRKAAEGDHFAIDMDNNPTLKAMYLDAEEDSGYIRDRSVFGDDISIEDTMAVLVRYRNGAMMSYSLNSYLPWEGFNVMMNGSGGRIEYHAVERPYINAAGSKNGEGAVRSYEILVYPMIGEPYRVPIEPVEGGHGGGDPVMLRDLFRPGEQEDPFHRAADHRDGIRSMLVGAAANRSIASGLPVAVDSLVRF